MIVLCRTATLLHFSTAVQQCGSTEVYKSGSVAVVLNTNLINFQGHKKYAKISFVRHCYTATLPHCSVAVRKSISLKVWLYRGGEVLNTKLFNFQGHLKYTKVSFVPHCYTATRLHFRTAVQQCGSAEVYKSESLAVQRLRSIEHQFNHLLGQRKSMLKIYLCQLQTQNYRLAPKGSEKIVGNRFKEKTIVIGKHCSNKYECDNINCFMPVEIFKAGKIHKMDITINIWMRASFVVC